MSPLRSFKRFLVECQYTLMRSIKGNENFNAMSPFLVFFIVVILINIFFINNFCKMRKLISRILIPEKFNLVKIWKKKIFCDFDICSFIFFYLGFDSWIYTHYKMISKKMQNFNFCFAKFFHILSSLFLNNNGKTAKFSFHEKFYFKIK